MILETERLILRPWEDSDAEDLYEYAKDPRVGPNAGWPVHRSTEDSLKIIRTVLSAPETYAVCLREDGRAVGSVGLMIGKASGLGIPDSEGEIGYWIGVPFWGKGLIPEAVREIIRHAFVDIGLERLWCCHYDGNEKSKRCMEKCGFRYHHTNENVRCSLLNEIRTEHVESLAMDRWKMEGNQDMGENIKELLTASDDREAYRRTKEIAAASEASDLYYGHIDEFASLLENEKSYVRTRAFILCASQSRWDTEGKLEALLPRMLKLLHDEKPTVVRQCLSALMEVAAFRPELDGKIREEMEKMDLSRYKDSMTPLIRKDINELLSIMNGD